MELELFPNPKYFFIAWALFLFTLVALNFILFRPLGAYLERRRKEIEETAREAARLKDEAQETFIRYNYQLSESRRTVLEEKGRARREMEDAVKAALTEVRRNANRTVDEAAERLAAEMTAVKDAMLADADRLADQFASHLLPAKGKKGKA